MVLVQCIQKKRGFLPSYNREKDFYRPLCPFGIKYGKPKIMRFQSTDKLRRFARKNYPYDGSANGKFLLQCYADKIPHCKTGTVSNVTEPIIEMLHNLPDGKQPDYHFKKTKKRGNPLHPFRDKYKSEGANTLI